jgi:hypothetical protein
MGINVKSAAAQGARVQRTLRANLADSTARPIRHG